MDLKNLVFEKIKDIDTLAGVDNLYALLTYTADSKMGDISLPCFSLAKTLRKSPVVIAEDIASKCKDTVFEKVEAVNGYLNFFLDKVAIYRLVTKEMENYTPSQIGKGKTVFLDFSSLNLAKYMHIGHLKNTFLGESLARLFEHFGYKVVRINYIGDYDYYLEKKSQTKKSTACTDMS